MKVLYSKEDKKQIYEDYKRGWVLGASGQSALVLTGTPAPVFRDWFDNGWENGHLAFREAMANAFNTIERLPLEDK